MIFGLGRLLLSPTLQGTPPKRLRPSRAKAEVADAPKLWRRSAMATERENLCMLGVDTKLSLSQKSEVRCPPFLLSQESTGILCLLSSVLSLFLYAGVCFGGVEVDKARYITIDEIRPGMPAWCLTVYEGTKVEKFDMQVIDIVRDFRPGRNLILAKGTDPRFIHTGPVAGSSGSPLYIDGRLAGALSVAWYFSKDPLYGATPIEEMLAVGRRRSKAMATERGEDSACAVPAVPALSFDFSKPLDFARVYEQITMAGPPAARRAAGTATLPIPLITSGLCSEATDGLKSFFEPLGFVTVGGMTGGRGLRRAQSSRSSSVENIDLQPGSVLTVPMVTGDIKLTALGTVTEVVGDKVYGFGHGFGSLGLGYGKINLPMATGNVNAVVANLQRSFKIGDALEIKGALMVDESAAVYGRIGAEAKMIPMTIKIDRYNDPQRVYNCRVAVNRLLTPSLVNSALAGAALMKGALPPDHFIRYKVDIATDGYGEISFENVSAGVGLLELTRQSVAPIALLMNNPYETVDITAVDFDVRIMAENIISHIWSVDLSDSKVKPGQTVDVSVIIESYLSQKRIYKYELQIPPNLPPGKYRLTVSGGSGYKEFLLEAAPYRFTAEDLPALIDAVNNLASIRSDNLYFVLSLPPGGLAIEKALLPDLPLSKALVLTDAKRTLETKPYQHWMEGQLHTGTVIVDKKTVEITVEK